MARKSGYTVELADAICEQIANGIPLREVCRQEGMPAWRTVYDWLHDEPDFAARFARSRDLGADHIAETCLEIADDARNDWMEKFDREGTAVGWQLNGDHVQRSKLRIETRLKLLAKWNPKKYGDKQAVELTGKDGGPVETADKSPVESARAIAFALAMGLRAKAKEPDSPPPAGEDLC